MSSKLPPSIFPARFQVLSGSMLKVIACIAMLIDHTGAIILKLSPPALNTLFYINGKGYYRHSACSRRGEKNGVQKAEGNA